MIQGVVRGMSRSAAAAAIGVSLVAAAAAQEAEESTNRVAVETDWSAFMEEDPRVCWAVSSPKETVNTRDGEVVEVLRGDILLFVTYRPDQDVSGEISFTGGYPFAEESTVSAEVGDETFQLFTDGEWAWPATPEDDDRLLEAFKAGAEVVLTGRSSRGTTTQDTFSLFGVTAILDAVEANCS